MKMAVIGVIIEGDRAISEDVNKILSEYGDYIIGRMGIPDRTNSIYVISIIAKASQEIISAIAGKLGRLDSVRVKSAVTDCGVLN